MFPWRFSCFRFSYFPGTFSLFTLFRFLHFTLSSLFTLQSFSKFIIRRIIVIILIECSIMMSTFSSFHPSHFGPVLLLNVAKQHTAMTHAYCVCRVVDWINWSPTQVTFVLNNEILRYFEWTYVLKSKLINQISIVSYNKIE